MDFHSWVDAFMVAKYRLSAPEVAGLWHYAEPGCQAGLPKLPHI